MNREPTFPPASPPVELRRRTIAFTSGKGGVGKSNLVLNTALLLARRGRSVAILDGDLGLANLNVLMGLSPLHDLRHVIAGDKRLDEITVRGPHGILVIPAGSGVAELANLAEDEREGLLDQLAEIEQSVEFLLIDTGAGLSDTVLNLIVASDEAVVVTQPEPTALADAYALIKVIVQHHAAFPFHILLNMVRDREQARQVYDSLARILVRFLGYQPGYAGYVTTDPCVAHAVVQQVPFSILHPRCAAARCLEELASTLLGSAAPAPRDAPTFWEKVASWRWGNA